MRILMSACRHERSVVENNAKLHALAAYLIAEGIKFEVAVGCYPEAGQEVSTEVTYVCHVNTEGWGMDEVDALAQSWAGFAATQYDQECVGIVFDGDFYLAYPSAPLEHVGRFTEVATQPIGKPCTFYRGKWYVANVEAA